MLVLQSWVGGVGCNSTLIVLVPSHEDVAIHSPVGAPAVEREGERGA